MTAPSPPSQPEPRTEPQPYPVAPTHADVSYGPHERHVLDYWAPHAQPAGADETPPPLVIYVHGGGFMRGDKSNVQLGLLDTCPAAGLALATINYRLSDEVDAPQFMLDGARALQYLRAHAERFGFDPKRVAMCGSSAGAGISLWVAFHDDLANPASDDPVERQSTRVNCVVIRNGQCSYDPRLFRALGLDAAIAHPFIEPFYGMPRDRFDTPEAHAAFDRAAAITYVRPGAPPVFATFNGSMDPVPAAPEPGDPDPDATWRTLAGRAVHHPRLGLHLKEKLEAVGSTCIVEPGAKSGDAQHQRVLAFLQSHLT